MWSCVFSVVLLNNNFLLNLSRYVAFLLNLSSYVTFLLNLSSYVTFTIQIYMYVNITYVIFITFCLLVKRKCFSADLLLLLLIYLISVFCFSFYEVTGLFRRLALISASKNVAIEDKVSGFVLTIRLISRFCFLEPFK